MKTAESKSPSSVLPAWLDVLRAVVRPRSVLLVGAGAGQGPWVQWLIKRQIKRVCLVEGDEQRFEQLVKVLPPDAGWTPRREVVAPSAKPVDFHCASNPAESGLISPDHLKALWPNIETEQVVKIQAPVTLDMLNADIGGGLNWLVLDCLPAAALLQGGEKLLTSLDVVLLRVAENLPSELQADPDAVDQLLQTVGLRRIKLQAERNPALSYALYVRDIAQLKAALSEAEAEAKAAEAKAKAKAVEASTARSTLIGPGKGDAAIDDLIEDLSLLFYGKRITYVDVGAHVGDVLLKFLDQAKKFSIREAHLFEPNPDSYAKLTENIAEAKVAVKHAYNLAVGGDQGEIQLIKAGSLTKSLGDASSALGNSDDVFTIRCVSLDSQRQVFTDGRINLLKIDVEGHEMSVLEGARQLLENHAVDIIYIEVGFNRRGTQQTYFADVDQFLQPLGYRVLRIYEQTGEWMSSSPLLRRCNFAYMSEKFADAHPLKLMQELQKLQGELSALKSGKPLASD